MDTGADSSVLMPVDSRRLGIDFNLLIGKQICTGIGGSVELFVEHGVLVFSDPGVALYTYDLNINIMADDVEMEDMSSLLGRDVIDRWRIIYDPQGDGLTATVRDADKIFYLLHPDAS